MSKPKLTWKNFKKDKFLHTQLFIVGVAVVLTLLIQATVE